MKISGGPDELATFIRALNDEPVYIVEEKPREIPLPLVRPRAAPPAPQKNLATAWLIFAILGAFALAMFTAHGGV